MTPTMVNFQVQYLVSFIVGLIGDLTGLLSGAVTTFGTHLTTSSGNMTTMAALTTGIFGTENGLIYWINDKVFYLLTHLPYAAIGTGLREILGNNP